MDVSVVLSIIFLNWKEATVYFWLAVISGLLIFSSCVLGKYLSTRVSNPPPPPHTPYTIRSNCATPYWSHAPSRSHSLHTLAFIPPQHHQQGQPGKLSSPTFSLDTWRCNQTLGKGRNQKYIQGYEDAEEMSPWIIVQGQHRQPRSGEKRFNL